MPISSNRPNRRTILITGASSGLGAEMARIYAAAGHDLALCARRLDKLEELRASLKESHPSIRLEIQSLDVDKPETVAAVFESLDGALGGIDRVIVNAGVGKGGPLGQGRAADNLAIARTNFVGALAQVEAALTLFRRRDAGHLVLIGSVAGVRSLPGSFATYSASKIALASLGRSLQIDFAGSQIRISIVAPGNIRTPLSTYRPPMLLEVDARTGARAIVSAINRERPLAYAPRWRWSAMAFVMRWMPKRILARLVD